MNSPMTMWEWDLITAALQYYERGRNITSASFPADVIKHYWKDPDRDPADLVRIARQFVDVYHGLNGAEFWSDDSSYLPIDADPWIVFYEFCKGFVHGFGELSVQVRGSEGVEHRMYGFMAKTPGGGGKPRWYSVDDYIENPVFPHPIDGGDLRVTVLSKGAFDEGYEAAKT